MVHQLQTKTVQSRNMLEVCKKRERTLTSPVTHIALVSKFCNVHHYLLLSMPSCIDQQFVISGFSENHLRLQVNYWSQFSLWICS